MSFLFSWIVPAASILISWKYCAGYWVVGPVFAAACLLLQYEKVRKAFSLNHLLFAAVSTLVYALVFWISDKGWRFKTEWIDMLIGSLSAGVVLGSILMPVFHTMLFSGDLKTVRKISFLLAGSWYLTLWVSFVDDAINLPGRIDYSLIAIALWQGIYFKNLKVS